MTLRELSKLETPAKGVFDEILVVEIKQKDMSRRTVLVSIESGEERWVGMEFVDVSAGVFKNKKQ